MQLGRESSKFFQSPPIYRNGDGRSSSPTHTIWSHPTNQKDRLLPIFFRSLEMVTTDAFLADASKKEVTIVFNHIGNLGVTVRRAVLQVLYNSSVLIQS